MNNLTYIRRVFLPSVRVIAKEWWAARSEGGYGGLTDARGYLQLGSRRVHVDALRDCSVEDISKATGVSVEDLRAWARGPGFTLGLTWDQYPPSES